MLAASLPLGCRAPAEPPAALASASADPLDAAGAQARQSNRPLAVLVVDAARSAADRAARSTFESAVATDPAAISVVLDLNLSRNRAAAAPLHALDGPTLLCISPAGVIISHDQGAVTAERIRQRIDSAAESAAPLDQQLRQLQAAAADPSATAAQMSVARFLLAHQNDREAIPPLETVAHDDAAPLDTRVQAWVDAGRAHLRIGEPEKARHSAQQLIATLGPRTPLAVAGGELVRGLQDTKAKRFDRAADELHAAIAAAPQSPYGTEAAQVLAKLPKPGT